MGQQPLVAGCEPCVFFTFCLENRLFRVRALGQNNGNAETCLRCLTRRIVERRAVDLDGSACRNAEGLDLRGIEHTVFDFVFLCQQQHEIRLADVDLTVSVIFETVQLCVVAPAHADLDRHAAVSTVTHFIENTAGFKYLDARLIGRTAFRHGNRLHGRDERCCVKTGQNLAVRLECVVGNRVNFHKSSCYRKSRL